MCIAAPMRVIKINEGSRSGVVSFSGNELTVNLGLVSVKEGDYVLVHAGCAVERISETRAEEIAEIFDLIGESANDP